MFQNYSKKQYISCTNCNKVGHIQSNCPLPIVSIGIIAMRLNELGVREYLVVKRRDSLGYSDFLRGKYNVSNKNHVKNLIDEMTLTEKKKIISENFETLWSGLWGNNKLSAMLRNDDYIAKEKFNTVKTGLMVNNDYYNTNLLINESKGTWEEAEWGFPKGRRNFNERDIDCAQREWKEETGHSLEQLNIIQNIVPYEEIFTGSNYKSYVHKYFIGVYSGTEQICEDKLHYHRNEISEVRWMTCEECEKNFRSYNKEKVAIPKKVETALQKFELKCLLK